MRNVAVIGLGRFGMELARQLAANGVQVLAIDRSGALIDEIKDDVAVAVRMDATDKHALIAQEIDKVDVCVIAIGEHFESALLTTVLAQKLGVERVICRAQTEFHAEIFHHLGVDEVLQPEVQAGEQVARRLSHPHLVDVISLADDYTLIELQAPAAFCDKSVKDLQLRTKYDVNLVAIKRPVKAADEDEADGGSDETDASDTTSGEREETISVPRPTDVVQAEDILVVVGSDEALAKLPKE